MAPQNYETKIFETNNKKIEKSTERQNGTIRGCSGTTNPGVTWKLDNFLKGIWNPIIQKPDNLIKGIWNLEPNRIQIQCPKGLTVPT